MPRSQPHPRHRPGKKVLEDFTIFWTAETGAAARRQFLSLIFADVWLDEQRVVAVQPKPSFLPFFETPRETPRPDAGVNE